MFSIQKLIGRDGKFYDLLEASAQQADSSVHHLVALLEKLQQNETPEHLEEFAHSRREDKRITQELTEQLSKTFVTPLEREDIQELAAALYKIPKTVEKIGERILICPDDLRGHSFQKQVELLDQAAETVLAMVKQLRKRQRLSRRRKRDRHRSLDASSDAAQCDRDGCVFQSYRRIVRRRGCFHDRQRTGGHRHRHNDDGALRRDRRICMEHRHVVARFAVQFESRADRRALRRSVGRGARQLVRHKME